jgi:hypothetical protein
MRAITYPISVAIAVAAFAVTGCAGSEDPPAAPTTTTTTDQAQRLRSCLREQGIDVPDASPGQDARAQVLTVPEGVTPEKWAQAQRACASAGSEQGAGQGTDDDQTAIARCMRGKGFDVPDPEPVSGVQPAGKVPAGADPEKFIAALNECAG